MVRRTVKKEQQSIGNILADVIKSKQSAITTKTTNINIVDVITFAKEFIKVDFSEHPYMDVILKLFYIKTLGNDNLTITDEDIEKIKKIHNYSKYIKREGEEDSYDDDDDLDVKYSQDYINIIEEQSKIWGGDYWLGKKIEILEQCEKNPFQYLILVLGRRSGKSFVSAIIACYEAYKLLSMVTCMKCKEIYNLKSGENCPVCGEKLINHPQSYYSIYGIEYLQINLAATKQGQAIKPMLNYIEGFLSQCSFFDGKWHRSDGDGTITFKTEYDYIYMEKRLQAGNSEFKGSIIIVTLGGNTKGQHGMGAVLSIFDEFALFNQEGVDTDAAIIDAIIPASALYRRKRGDGRIIMLSMPEYEEGKFYEHYKQGIDFNNKYFKQHLVFQMPSWEYNITYTTEYLVDEFGAEFGGSVYSKKFKQIYGAQFISFGHDSFIPEKYVDMAIDTSLYIQTIPKDRTQRYYMHIDCAGTGNANYAYLIGHWISENQVKIFVEDRSFYWTPSQLKDGVYEGKDKKNYTIDFLINEIIRIAKLYNVSQLSFDLMQSEESKYSFRKNGINLKRISFSGVKQGELYGLLNQLLLERRVRLCKDDELLALELKSLKLKTEVNSRGSQIFIPRNGEIQTKDLADCLAGAIFSSYNQPLGINAQLPASSIYIPNTGGQSIFSGGFSSAPRSSSIFDRYRQS